MPSLVIRAEGQNEEKISLESSVVTLGRAIDSDIRLNDVRSSRKHCQIVGTPEGYTVVDLGSGNGTKVNGVRIKEHKLNSGDLIQIGSTLILFSADGSGVKPAPRPEPPVTNDDFLHAQMVTQVMPRATEAMLQPFASADQPQEPEPTRSSRRVGARTTRNLPAVGGGGTAITSRRMGMKGTTSRTSARTGGGQPGASSRFAAAAKKKSPVKFIVIGAVVVGVAAYFMMSGSGGLPPGRAKIKAEDINGEIATLETDGKFKEAIAKCDEGAKLLENYTEDKELEKMRRGFKVKKTNLENMSRTENEAIAKCKEFEDLVKKTELTPENSEKLRKISEDAKEMITKYARVTSKTSERIKAIVERSREYYLQAGGNKIEEEFSKLDIEASNLLKGNKYGEAYAMYKEFAAKYESKVVANKARTKMEKLNNAMKSLVTEEIKPKAEEKAAENKDDAIKYLNDWKANLKGTEVEPEVDKVINEINAK